MAVTTVWYGQGLNHFVNGAVDWDTDTIKVSLHTSSYTPNQDTHDFFDDVGNELAAGSGYTAGGETLANRARNYDSATNQIRLDADDTTWTFTGTKTFRYAVVRKARGGAASADELIGYVDLGTDQTVSTDYTLRWAAEGIFYIQAAAA